MGYVLTLLTNKCGRLPLKASEVLIQWDCPKDIFLEHDWPLMFEGRFILVIFFDKELSRLVAKHLSVITLYAPTLVRNPFIVFRGESAQRCTRAMHFQQHNAYRRHMSITSAEKVCNGCAGLLARTWDFHRGIGMVLDLHAWRSFTPLPIQLWYKNKRFFPSINTVNRNIGTKCSQKLGFIVHRSGNTTVSRVR